MDENPEVICACGVSHETSAVAIAAYNNDVEFAHIETEDADEQNIGISEARSRMLRTIAEYNFVVSENEKKLIEKGIEEKEIYYVGNTSIDMFKYTLKK